jgi:hypothetical protein
MSDDSAAKHRAKQTVNNLILALLASLGIVLVTVLAVPRDDSNRIQPVDYQASVAAAEASSSLDILAPTLPQGWWSNRATWHGKTADDVNYFETGFVGPKNQYVLVTQAFQVNPTWVALASKDYGPDSEALANNQNWTKWFNSAEGANDPYFWTYEYAGNLITLRGSTPEDLKLFADIIEAELQ